MEPEHWLNYLQTLSWVFTRNEDVVSLFRNLQPTGSDIPRLEGVARDDGFFHLEMHPDVIIRMAMIQRPGAELDSYEEADFDIRLKLQAGSVDCWGRRASGSDLEKIPRQEWADLTILYDLADPSVESTARSINDAGEVTDNAPPWRFLRFERDNVLACWPVQEVVRAQNDAAAPKSDSKNTHSTKAQLRATLKIWLEKKTRKYGDRRTKTRYLEKAQEEISGEVTPNLFKGVWTEAVLPSEVRKQGRRR